MSLATVGRINVPRRCLQHPHVQEARCLAEVLGADGRLERVIGTHNGPSSAPPSQLYGWGPNVARHHDDTGFIYFSPLLLRRSVVHVYDSRQVLRHGEVYRLHDFATHWTRDTAPVVCIFTGPMLVPHDAVACKQLQDGVDALARGGRDAPRVSKGFRVPLRGECWASTSDGEVDLVQIEEAKRNHWIIARCAKCERFAVRVDDHFPYHSDLSRCAVHSIRADDQTVPRETFAEAA